MNGKHIKQALKIGVSLALLIYVIRMVDWKTAGDLIQRAHPGWIALAVGLLTLERVISVYKWHLLLKRQHTSLSFWRLFVIHYIGGFWGLVLPSSVGADIVRGYYLSKSTANLSLTVTSMVVDRLMAGIALVSMGGVGAWMKGASLGWPHIRLCLTGLLGGFVLALALFSYAPFLRWIDRHLFQRGARIRAVSTLRRWTLACLEYRHYPGTLGACFGLSILMQAVRVLVFYVIALTFGITVSVLYYFLFIPLITVLIMLPVSFSGIGLREGSFVAFFALIGVPASESFIISFTVSVLTILATAVGGLFYMVDRSGRPPLEAPEN